MKVIFVLILSCATASCAVLGGDEVDAAFLHARSHPHFRQVDGQFYDISGVADFFTRYTGPSVNPMPEWQIIIGKVLSVTEGGLIVQTHTVKGYDMFGMTERTIFLKNYPSQQTITDDRHVAGYAMAQGRTNYLSVSGATRTVELWDFGTKPPDQKIAAHLEDLRRIREMNDRVLANAREVAMQRQQLKREERTQREILDLESKAKAGEGYAQFALGMRYFSGRGVETNRALAMQWLRAAMTNGNTQASNELARIKETK